MMTTRKWMVSPCQTCMYVVSDETGEAVIIDCAAYHRNERKRLLDYIATENLHPVRLLLTHAHHDHLYGNDLVLDNYGLLPEVHISDKELMTVQLEERIKMLFKNYPYPIPMPQNYLTDADVICFGHHKLQVIHTPGHTPGSVFFYCEEEGVAFSGDTLFYRNIGRSDLYGGSKEALYASLKKITTLLPDDTVIYPGHTKKTTIGFEKVNNPYIIDL